MIVQYIRTLEPKKELNTVSVKADSAVVKK
jgi:hypothetical protein